MIWIVLGVAALVVAVLSLEPDASGGSRAGATAIPTRRRPASPRIPSTFGVCTLEAVHREEGSVGTLSLRHRATQNGSDTTLKSVTVVVVAAAMLVLSGCMSEPPAGVSRVPGGEPGGTIAPAYPTNEAGQTYGAEDDNVSFEDRPDLILVQATNGRQGYVLRETLDEVTGANVSSPQEALEWQRRQDEAGWDRLVIPVFLSDGVIQIGVFEVGRSVPDDGLK